MFQRDEKGQVDLGRWELPLQFLIVLNLVSIAVETLPDLPSHQRAVIKMFDCFSIGIFTIEYLIRFWWAKPRLRYGFSFFGIIDLLAIAPFYLGLSVDLRGMRVVRHVRLFRILKLARYSRAIRRLRRAFMLSREELILFATTALIIVYIAGVGIYYFEKEAQPEKFRSMFDGLWWAVATLTTVGFGDLYPVTAGGRFFTFAVLCVGLGIIAVPTGLVAAALGRARREEEEERRAQERAAGTEVPPPSSQ